MAGLKLVRAGVSPSFADHTDDVDGYMLVFRQVMGEDLLSVSDYLEHVEDTP